MSAEKGQKLIWLPMAKNKKYVAEVQRIKRETHFQGMSYSKMCDLGSEVVIRAYNQLTKKEIHSIQDEEDFKNLIRSKLFGDKI